MNRGVYTRDDVGYLAVIVYLNILFSSHTFAFVFFPFRMHLSVSRVIINWPCLSQNLLWAARLFITEHNFVCLVAYDDIVILFINSALVPFSYIVHVKLIALFNC